MWITANTVNELDQRTAQDISQALPANRAASLGLMELTEDRRGDVRGLAARCLGYLGQFDPMTAALNDGVFRREWPEYINQLKEAIARGPETAAAIRQSLEKQYGSEPAASLYRMLWGYTDKDLENGWDDRLVRYLDDQAPVFRVLAFENLKDITHKELYYKPEATAVKRQPSVQQWQRQQRLGRIRFNVPEVKPRGTPAALPPKGTIPAPPKPLDRGAADEVKATRAAVPILPGDPSTPERGAAGAIPSGRQPVSVPEPDALESRPRIVFPEPPPTKGP